MHSLNMLKHHYPKYSKVIVCDNKVLPVMMKTLKKLRKNLIEIFSKVDF